MFKLIPLLCTHVYLYMFSTVHPPRHLDKREAYATFQDSAQDPIFFTHHANVDLLWRVEKNLPGGRRQDLTDTNYVNTDFTFYDENGILVTMSITESLDPKLLR